MTIKKYLLGIFILLVFIFVNPQAVSSYSDDNDYKSVIVKLNSKDKLYKIDLAENENYQELLSTLEKEPLIDFVVPNHRYELALSPNDTYYSSEWYMDKVGAPAAWDTTTGSNEIIIAVLDTGVDIDHPDLSANIWRNTSEIPNNGIDDDSNGFIDDYNGWDFVGELADPNPKFDTGWTESGIHHGTVVAGAAGAIGNNNQGVAGLAWNIKIMPIRVLDSVGVGDTKDVYEGISYAVNNGADFINLSFVGNNQDVLLEDAINNAWANEVTIFAAAGNDNVDLDVNPRYPVCNNYVIGVGGVDQNDVKWSRNTTTGSNYGNCVDIVSPATGFMSTVFYDPSNSLDSYYMNGWSGTSLATPLVTAAAALAKSYDVSATPDQIIQRIYDETVNIDSLNIGYTGKLGNGRLNLANIFLQPINTTSLFNILTGIGAGASPQVKVFQADGTLDSEFLAYAANFTGGVNIASGDLDGDGVYEIVSGVGINGAPQVRTLDQTGNPIFTPGFYAYGENFRGGVNVAVGDLDGDGVSEIIAGAGNGGAPQIRTFDRYGNPIFTPGFYAYGENFRGGVNVAVGDLDGDGVSEIIAGAGNGGAPQIRTFDRYGNPIFTPGFYAYGENFRGGVNVAVGDLDGDGVSEIIAGAGNGGAPQIRTFDRYGNPIFTPGFYAYGENFRGGVNVAVGDLDGDGVSEIIAGAGNGGAPHIRIFDRYGVISISAGFFAYDLDQRGGISVSAIKKN